MMNAITTMAIDTFMNADIELDLPFEIIFVIRIRYSTMSNLFICNVHIHSKGSQIAQGIKRINETSTEFRLPKIVNIQQDAMQFSILYTIHKQFLRF